jgi:hypothetical protein
MCWQCVQLMVPNRSVFLDKIAFSVIIERIWLKEVLALLKFVSISWRLSYKEFRICDNAFDFTA